MSEAQPLYRIQFINNGERYELFVREVSQGDLWGFIEIGDFVWDSHSGVVIDTSEEKLKAEFSGVKRTYIPMHNVLRIDAVEKRGKACVSQLDGKVTHFPSPVYTPKNKG